MKINIKKVLLLVSISLIVSVPYALAHTDVTAEQAHELIGSTDALTVIDVREPSEYCSTRGHIPGALNYPWNSGMLQARYEELPMDSAILVVCQSGGRSNQAATFLDSKGFSMVYDMMGGMSAWIWETEPCVEVDEKYSGGTGEPNDPYQIATAEDLMLLGESPEDYDKHFILTADIDLAPNLPGRKVFDRAVIAPENIYDDPEVFGGTSFSGHFNGNGYVISNLKIQGSRYLGLFGRLEVGAEITNLGLDAIDVNGTGPYVGGLVGCNMGSEIAACNSSGMIYGGSDVAGLAGYNSSDGSIRSSFSISMVSGEWFDIGGLVGRNFGIIYSSFSIGTVNGNSFDVGGLVGSNGGSITESYSTGTVTGYSRVGGLVGSNLIGPATRFEGPEYIGSIIASYSTSTVIGDEWSIGGLVGENHGTISACYSMGMASADREVGGLVGENKSGNISFCYSIGVVSGSEYIGGLAGMNVGDSIISDSFWDIQASELTYSDGGTGKTTIEMQMASTFLESGWDFVGEADNGTEDIWSICEGTNYPRLVWQIPADDFVCPDGITIADFAFFMEHWLDDNCDSSNGYCDGTDLDQSGTVDAIDLEIFFESWPVER